MKRAEVVAFVAGVMTVAGVMRWGQADGDSQGNVKDCEPVARREEPEEDLVSRAVDEDVVDGTREMASQPNLQPSAVQPDSGDDDEDEVCHLVEEQEAVSELLKARDLAKRYRLQWKEELAKRLDSERKVVKLERAVRRQNQEFNDLQAAVATAKDQSENRLKAVMTVASKAKQAEAAAISQLTDAQQLLGDARGRELEEVDKMALPLSEGMSKLEETLARVLGLALCGEREKKERDEEISMLARQLQLTNDVLHDYLKKLHDESELVGHQEKTIATLRARIADLERGMSAASTVESTPFSSSAKHYPGGFSALDEMPQSSPHRALVASDAQQVITPDTPAYTHMARGYGPAGDGGEMPGGPLYFASPGGQTQTVVLGSGGGLYRSTELVQLVTGAVAAPGKVARKLDIGMAL